MVPEFPRRRSLVLVSPVLLLCLLFPREMERICDIVFDTQVRKFL